MSHAPHFLLSFLSESESARAPQAGCVNDRDESGHRRHRRGLRRGCVSVRGSESVRESHCVQRVMLPFLAGGFGGGNRSLHRSQGWHGLKKGRKGVHPAKKRKRSHEK